MVELTTTGNMRCSLSKFWQKTELQKKSVVSVLEVGKTNAKQLRAMDPIRSH